MVSAIVKEMAMQKDYLNASPLKSIYFGGGTPSLLTKGELARIFEAIHTQYSVDADAEITLEANPDDIDSKALATWKATGINRLSVGIQSFDGQQLKFMNRSHDAKQAENCIKQAQDAGFDNFSLDLIYGIPSESHEIWQQNLEKALAFDIKHLSAYCLTIEEKTVFGHRLKKKKMQPIDEELSAKQFEMLLSETEKWGLEQYEISNFSKPGFHAQHNTSYWFGEPYLGIGPSAHSFNGKQRQWNLANNALYIKHILSENKLPFEQENLSSTERANELIMTQLRTKWGLNVYQLEEFGLDLNAFEKSLLLFEEQGLVQNKSGRLTLSGKGKLQADYIASELFFD